MSQGTASIERSMTLAARVPLQTQLVVTLSFRDDQVRRGVQYEYSIAAVDTHGNEGPAATVTVEVQ